MTEHPDSPLMILCRLCDGELSTILQRPEYIQGLIFAVAAAPEIPMPEQWLVWVFKERGQLKSEQQADQLTDLLMSLLKEQLQKMRDDEIIFPTQYEYPHNKNTSASEWLNGLLAGHAQLETVWQNAWNRMSDQKPAEMVKMQKNLKHCLMMFTTFADVETAIKKAQKANNETLIDRLPVIFKALPEALKTYVGLSGELVDFMPNQFEQFTQNN